jgi:ribulose-phosphate 3-epimerase
LGLAVGVVINPATPASAIDEVLAAVDLVLVMTVNPGFGGQQFIRATLPKIQRLRQRLDQLNPQCDLEVDGGIDVATAPRAVEAGARVLVAGSAIFKSPLGIAGAMRQLQDAVKS